MFVLRLSIKSLGCWRRIPLMVLDAGQPLSPMYNDRSMMACSGFTLVRFVLNVNEDDVGHIKLWFGAPSYAAFFFW